MLALDLDEDSNIDTGCNRHTLDAAKHSAGASVTAMELVMTGQAKNAMVCGRPPGKCRQEGLAGLVGRGWPST